jgi:lysozyme family protein
MHDENEFMPLDNSVPRFGVELPNLRFPQTPDAVPAAAANTESVDQSADADTEGIDLNNMPNLEVGDFGPEVLELKKELAQDGFAVAGDPSSNAFGPDTTDAVVAFQRSRGLDADGVVGPQTWLQLRMKGNPSTNPPSSANPPSTSPTGPKVPAPTTPSTPVAHPPGVIGQLLDQNTARAANARPDPRYQKQVDDVMRSLTPAQLMNIDKISQLADVPPALVCGIWYREASLQSGVYLQNGDPLGAPTVHVPKGIFFRKDQFVDAAVAALNDKRSLINELGLHRDSTDMGAITTFAEAYNGLGYHSRGLVSPYAFAGTDQYKGGMFVSDGVFSPSTFDGRPGVLAIAEAFNQKFG